MPADLEAAIAAAWEDRASVTPASTAAREPVEAALALLDSGEARVAEPDGSPPIRWSFPGRCPASRCPTGRRGPACRAR